MKIVEHFDNQILEEENAQIPLKDGVTLAARIWRPQDSDDHPVPAILEFLPYRKRDGTAVRDHLTHPYFAGHGYACVRVDMRGNGESEGLMWDEYLKEEQDDCIEVLEWIAAQPWSTGRAGMIGISWGGFNGLQVAMRQPESLKAVITICSTVDRYADDIHYKGGCLLDENLGWSTTMMSFSSRPPDPALVGERWREMWRERLENLPHLMETWLEHQQHDDYWRHGSLQEDYGSVQCPVLAVGGWSDAYKNAVPALVENLKQVPCKGIVGPWIHKYPHFAEPGPRIGFLQECLRWWDRWLKDENTGVENDPDYRVFRQDCDEPKARYEERKGEWISEPVWPSPNLHEERLYLTAAGLARDEGPGKEITYRSPEDTGEAAGDYCAMWLGPDLPPDQRKDDGRSLTFDSPILDAETTILGAPRLKLRLAVDRPQAHIAVRLNAVHPDGAVERVTYGLLNLSQRKDRDAPSPMTPGKAENVEVTLDHCCWRFPKGVRLRVSISNAYWPLTWPDPEPVTLTVFAGPSHIILPVRKEAGQPTPSFEAPEGARPMPRREARPPENVREYRHDLASGLSTADFSFDSGEYENQLLGLTTGSVARKRFEIDPKDPTSASMEGHWTQTLSREGWAVRTEARARLTADRENFHLQGRLEAYDGDELFHEKTWEKTIKRRFL
jgi:putative CocE/NonD family hydrolase